MQTKTVTRVTPRKSAAKTEVKAPRKAVAAKAVSPLKVTAGVAQKFYVFVEGARPTSGTRLAAHTNAVLFFLGLAEQHAVKKNAALALLGTRAVKYHKDIGNLSEKADTVSLTKKGFDFFSGRVAEGKVDTELSAAFLAAIQKGKTNDAAQIKENHLVPVGMVVR